MSTSRPSPSLLRGLTDETVIRSPMVARAMTRAQVAEATGLSKPAVAESFSRLVDRGLLADTGERTTGRGGVGSLYALTPGAGVAIAVVIDPTGLVVEMVNPAGDTLDRQFRAVPAAAGTEVVGAALSETVATACAEHPRDHVRVAAVSAAGPVDRDSGRVVPLPDDPFIASLDPRLILDPHVGGRVGVDNDVNWAARAEHAERERRTAGSADDFVYCYLGAGLGCAIVSDGQVRRGHSGLSGEISHIITTDGGRRGLPLTALFEDLAVHRPNSSAIDVERLRALLGADPGARERVAAGLAGVLSAAVGFLDPAFVVLGGPWADDVRADVQAVVDDAPRGVRLTAPEAGDEPALAGVRAAAHAWLLDDLVTRARG